jgi:hypothetical protein
MSGAIRYRIKFPHVMAFRVFAQGTGNFLGFLTVFLIIDKFPWRIVSIRLHCGLGDSLVAFGPTEVRCRRDGLISRLHWTPA